MVYILKKKIIEMYHEVSVTHFSLIEFIRSNVQLLLQFAKLYAQNRLIIGTFFIFYQRLIRYVC